MLLEQGIGMEEAKVSDPPEAARQDVPEQQPEKFPARHGADLTLSFVVLIAETDLTITVIDDVLFRQNAAIEVSAQLEQRLWATPNLLAVHHPFIRQGLLAMKTCQPHALKPFGPEHT